MAPTTVSPAPAPAPLKTVVVLGAAYGGEYTQSARFRISLKAVQAPVQHISSRTRFQKDGG